MDYRKQRIITKAFLICYIGAFTPFSASCASLTRCIRRRFCSRSRFLAANAFCDFASSSVVRITSGLGGTKQSIKLKYISTFCRLSPVDLSASQKKRLRQLEKRIAELDELIKKLYEDRVLGHISVEQFQTLSSGCTEEQEKLAVEIPTKEAAIWKLQDTVSGTDGFIAKAKWSKKAMQSIEIYYSDIGFIGGDIPQSKKSPRKEISARFLPWYFPKS